MNLLNQGGSFFMYPLVLMLLLIVILFVKELIKKGSFKKVKSLIASISLFAIVWGFLGQIIGLMSAFDAIQAAGDISLGILAAGLKISFYAPAFGMLIFLVGRLGIIILTWMKK
ncbi:MAG: MotA/TolQ/ExbB proton channel family protein [Lutibacter sp.]|nr:MotA/TolQ/ExbB proton channel family protein [Lutibacter sp.]